MKPEKRGHEILGGIRKEAPMRLRGKVSLAVSGQVKYLLIGPAVLCQVLAGKKQVRHSGQRYGPGVAVLCAYTYSGDASSRVRDVACP